MKKRIVAVAMLMALVFCAACGKSGKKFALGKIQDGKYTNSYVGVSFEAKDSWDIAAATDAGEVDYEGAYQINEFQANNPDEMQSINIMYQAISEDERKTFNSMSEKECVKKLISVGEIEEGYAQQGFDVLELSSKQVKFLGEKRTAVYSHLDYFGLEYFVLQIIDFEGGDYMPIITFGSYYEDHTEEMLSLFKSYK